VSLRSRLVLAAAYLLGVVVVVLEFPLAITLQKRADFEFQSNVLSTAALVSSRISDEVFRAGGDPSGVPNPPATLTNSVTRSARFVAGARIVVVDAAGRVLVDSDAEAPVGTLYATGERPEFGIVLRGGDRVSAIHRFSETRDRELLLVTVPVLHNGRVVGAVRVSEPTAEIDSRVRRAWIGLGLIGLGVIAVGLALAWFLATTVARPVRRLDEAAARLGDGDLDARAEETGPKEMATLAHSFNQMAAALAANISAQRDFVANASHQLRTPLTGLRLRLETIEQEGGPAGEQAAKAEAELDRLSDLVDDLMQLVRASSVESTGGPVDLQAVAHQAVDRWTAPAREWGQEVRLAEAVPARVWADTTDISHVIDNLIENAIRYCPPGARIDLRVAERDGRASLIVADDGPGIPADDRPRIFERFYRGSNGKRRGPGTGLGLAIVAELVHRWGGTISLTEREGTCIEATFPKVAGGGPTVS
jgi:signal transduction histidine kinase